MPRQILRRALTVVAWCALALTGAALVAAVLLPAVAGAKPYTVLTGSMEPTYPPGTLVVVKPVDVAAVNVGDVITYQIESGQAAVATHRVIASSITMDGDYAFRTQGDANEAPDIEPVIEEQIRGEVWYAVPYLGHVNSILNGQQRDLATSLVVIALLVYGASMITAAAVDRRSDHRSAAGKHVKQRVPA